MRPNALELGSSTSRKIRRTGTLRMRGASAAAPAAAETASGGIELVSAQTLRLSGNCCLLTNGLDSMHRVRYFFNKSRKGKNRSRKIEANS